MAKRYLRHKTVAKIRIRKYEKLDKLSGLGPGKDFTLKGTSMATLVVSATSALLV